VRWIVRDHCCGIRLPADTTAIHGRRLDGTVALVTGASSGIGEATAHALAAHGAKIVVSARRKDRLDAIVAAIASDGGTALAFEADVMNRDEAIAAVGATIEKFGRLDTLFNNAGVMLLGPIVDAPVEEWDNMVDLNLKGLLYTAHAAIPHLIEAAETSPRKVADLINTSSVAGRVANEGSGVYNLTKFGVNAFTESLRQEVTQKHVRVASMEPGAVLTELTDHLRDGVRESTKGWIAQMESLQSEDIADAVAYIVTRPRHVAINEMLIRPTDQKR
jgi:NADP-dependent 3-hydroxy acid dehydrogenase YdfG